ncbi:hypothetical protein [Macrococcoides caseolyticum]|uniref:hypothetical protein n=1 Tax=Macrococcoides caseolyticum TaxID=69966 RepID=UPI001F2934F6|nr:hypothetical protein [Macrococcus caseolyticus]MCE4957559.1 hypothetical protein [Macrococcus caseolyticus]
MKCSCKKSIGAFVFVAASGTLYYFLTKNQKDDTQSLSQEASTQKSVNVELVKPEPTPPESVGKEFHMPHFMVRNLVVTPNDNGVAFRLDYRIDRVLYNYLMHNTPHYRFRFTLPGELKPYFEGNGTAKMLGELVYGTGEKSDYSVTFNFKKNDDIESSKMHEISETTGPYHLDIVDEQLKVLNEYDDVYAAANLIRF